MDVEKINRTHGFLTAVMSDKGKGKGPALKSPLRTEYQNSDAVKAEKADGAKKEKKTSEEKAPRVPHCEMPFSRNRNNMSRDNPLKGKGHA